MSTNKLVFDRDPQSPHRRTGRSRAQMAEVERLCKAGESVLFVTCYPVYLLHSAVITERSPQRLASRLHGLGVKTIMLDHAAPRSFAEVIESCGIALMRDFYDLSLTSPWNVAEFMRLAKDERDWNRRCDVVKAENGGAYPKFWFENILKSGLAAEKYDSWTSEEKRMEAKASTPTVTIKPERPYSTSVATEPPAFEFRLSDVLGGLGRAGLRVVPEQVTNLVAAASMEVENHWNSSDAVRKKQVVELLIRSVEDLVYFTSPAYTESLSGTEAQRKESPVEPPADPAEEMFKKTFSPASPTFQALETLHERLISSAKTYGWLFVGDKRLVDKVAKIDRQDTTMKLGYASSARLAGSSACTNAILDVQTTVKRRIDHIGSLLELTWDIRLSDEGGHRWSTYRSFYESDSVGEPELQAASRSFVKCGLESVHLLISAPREADLFVWTKTRVLFHVHEKIINRLTAAGTVVPLHTHPKPTPSFDSNSSALYITAVRVNCLSHVTTLTTRISADAARGPLRISVSLDPSFRVGQGDSFVSGAAIAGIGFITADVGPEEVTDTYLDNIVDDFVNAIFNAQLGERKYRFSSATDKLADWLPKM